MLAVDTPYYGITGDAGDVTIAGVARGAYTYHAWRPGAAELTGPVTVGDSVTLELRWP